MQRRFKYLLTGLISALLYISIPAGVSAQALFDGNTFRAGNKQALLQLPELPSDWTPIFYEANKMAIVKIYAGKPQDFQGYIELIFPQAQTKVLTAQQVASYFAVELMNSAAFFKPLNEGKTFSTDTPGQQAFGIVLGGVNPGHVAEVAVVMAIADGSNSVVLIQRGNKEISKSRLPGVTQQILANLKLGRQVSKLPVHQPGTPLDGVFMYSEGLAHDWLVFDRRGYGHASNPNLAQLDVELLYQTGFKYLFKYQLKGNQVLRSYTDPTVGRKLDPLRLEGNTLWAGKHAYQRIKPFPDGTKLDGHYNAYSASSSTNYLSGDTFSYSSSSDYFFGRNGRFSKESFTSVQDEVKQQGSNDNAYETQASAAQNAAGTYQLKGMYLLLKFDSGRQEALTVFPNPAEEGVLYINSRMFIKQK